MNKLQRRILIIILMIAFPMLLTACALRSLFGNVIIVEDISEEANQIISTVFSDSTAAVCLDTDYGYYDCTYIIDGAIITSTFYLLSEYGITGVLIDPLILQVPADAGEFSATYDDGSGPEPLVNRTTGSFQATPDLTITAETGQQFVILELPPSVESSLPSGDPDSAPQFSYALSFTRTVPFGEPIDPLQVKAMLTGKAIINEHRYYVPLLPCATDFASLPALEIPQSANPVNLQTAVGDLIRQGGSVGCDHQGYYFNNVPPPPLKVYLALLNR
jgi:hypothetical protein